MADYEMFDMEVVRRQTWTWAEDLAAKANQRARDLFALECEGWRNVALRNRDELGILVPAKPVAPNVVRVTSDLNGWPMTVSGPDRVAPPCADLPPLPTAVEGVKVLIGGLAGGDYFRCLEGDTAPHGYVVEKDGATYRKVVGMFGGYWLKV